MAAARRLQQVRLGLCLFAQNYELASAASLVEALPDELLRLVLQDHLKLTWCLDLSFRMLLDRGLKRCPIIQEHYLLDKRMLQGQVKPGAEVQLFDLGLDELRG